MDRGWMRGGRAHQGRAEGLTAAALRPCFRARSFFLSRMHCTRWPIIASPLPAIARRSRLLPRALRSLPPSSAYATAGSVTAAASLLLTPRAASKLAHRSVVCVDDLGFAFAGRQRWPALTLGILSVDCKARAE